MMDPSPVSVLTETTYKEDSHGKRSIQVLPVYDDLRILVFTGNIDGSDGVSKDGSQCTTAGASVPNTRSSTGQYTCTADDILNDSKRAYLIDKMLATSASRLSQLRTFRSDNTTKLKTISGQGNCAGDVLIPSSFWTTGVDYDFILLVTARPIPPSGYPNTQAATSRTLATATTCQVNSLSRPIVGWANFDPSSLNPGDDQAEAMQLGVAMHEISHALGFSYSMFSDPTRFKRWDDAAGQFVNRDPGTVVKDVDTANNLAMIISPAVVAAAREHFDCSTELEGLMLEPAGGSGTAKSHWWKQILFSEYMTGTASATPVFSRLTLALFEDSGWYKPNYAAADPLGFGRKLGCSFAKNGCPNWPQKDGYGCTNELSKSCTGDFLAYGLCNPAGTFLLPCGYYQPQTLCIFEYKAENDPLKKTVNDLLSAGEEFGNSSRCFLSSLNKIDALSQIVPVPGLNTERCYRTRCQSKTKLRVHVDGIYYLCNYELGGEISPNGFGGTVKCSPRMADNICQNMDQEDVDWPTVTGVDPIRAKPDTNITIYGTNFNKTSNVSAVVEAPCTYVDVLNATALVCHLAGPEAFYNPRHLNIFGEYKVAIAVKDGVGRSDSLPESFSVQVEFNLQYLQAVWLWLTKNPIWAVVGAVILLIPCFLLCFCCYRKCKKQKKPKRGQFAHNYDAYDDEYHYDEDPSKAATSKGDHYDKPSKRK